MRKGGGKQKGSGFERKCLELIVKAFKKKGIKKQDAYRTILSGGTKDVKGDLQFSSALEKLFCWTVECKFYKSFNFYQLLYNVHDMQKSWKFKKWWMQLEDECRITGKNGLLVFKENNGDELAAFKVAGLDKELTKALSVLPKIEVKDGKRFIWIVRFKDLLKVSASL